MKLTKLYTVQDWYGWKLLACFPRLRDAKKFAKGRKVFIKSFKVKITPPYERYMLLYEKHIHWQGDECPHSKQRT